MGQWQCFNTCTHKKRYRANFRGYDTAIRWKFHTYRLDSSSPLFQQDLDLVVVFGRYIITASGFPTLTTAV